MKRSSVSSLKSSLSEYLAKVKKGEEVIVTEHGHPVARLVPFSKAGPVEGERERLAREGILELGSGKLSAEFLKPSFAKDPEGLLLKTLLEEREEGL